MSFPPRSLRTRDLKTFEIIIRSADEWTQRNHRAVKSADKNVTGDISVVVSPLVLTVLHSVISDLSSWYLALGICCTKGKESRTTSFSPPFLLSHSSRERSTFIHSGSSSFRSASSDTVWISHLVAVETRCVFSLSLSLSLFFSLPLSETFPSKSHTKTITAHMSVRSIMYVQWPCRFSSSHSV